MKMLAIKFAGVVCQFVVQASRLHRVAQDGRTTII
jgi:hypothetical protein